MNAQVDQVLGVLFVEGCLKRKQVLSPRTGVFTDMPRRGAARTFELGGPLPKIDHDSSSSARDMWLEVYGEAAERLIPGLSAEFGNANAALRQGPTGSPTILVSLGSEGDSPRVARQLRILAAQEDDFAIRVGQGGFVAVAYTNAKQFASAKAKVKVKAHPTAIQVAHQVTKEATEIACQSGDVAKVMCLVRSHFDHGPVPAQAVRPSVRHSVPPEGDAPVDTKTSSTRTATQLDKAPKKKKTRRGKRGKGKSAGRSLTFEDVFIKNVRPPAPRPASPPASQGPPKDTVTTPVVHAMLPSSRVQRGVDRKWPSLTPSGEASPEVHRYRPSAAAAWEVITRVVPLHDSVRTPEHLTEYPIKPGPLADLLSSTHVYSNVGGRACVQACLETAAGERVFEAGDLLLLQHAATINAAQLAFKHMVRQLEGVASDSSSSDIMDVGQKPPSPFRSDGQRVAVFRNMLHQHSPDDTFLAPGTPPVLLPGLHLLIDRINQGYRAPAGHDDLDQAGVDPSQVDEEGDQEGHLDGVLYAFALREVWTDNTAHLQLILVDHDRGKLVLWNPDIPDLHDELPLHKCMTRLAAEGINVLYRIWTTPEAGSPAPFRDRLRGALQSLRDDFPPLPHKATDGTVHPQTLIAGKGTRVAMPHGRMTRQQAATLEAEVKDPLKRLLPDDGEGRLPKVKDVPHISIGQVGGRLM